MYYNMFYQKVKEKRQPVFFLTFDIFCLFNPMFYLIILLINTPSISGKIERTVREGPKKQLFSGDIFLKIPDIFYLHLYKPVNQIFFIKKESLFIYYPADKRGFKGIVKNPMNNPLFDMMIVANKRIDLTPYNFRFLRKKMNGDTLYSEWVENSKGLPIIRIAKLNGKQILFEVYGKDKKLLARTVYMNHIKIGDFYFPLYSYSVIILPKDTLKENMEYKDVKIDSMIPDAIKNFHFPKGIKIDTLQL